MHRRDFLKQLLLVQQQQQQQQQVQWQQWQQFQVAQLQMQQQQQQMQQQRAMQGPIMMPPVEEADESGGGEGFRVLEVAGRIVVGGGIGAADTEDTVKVPSPPPPPPPIALPTSADWGAGADL